MDEMPLLRAYVDRQSEDAFRALVDRYVDLVFSAARRQLRDAHLAEDATQAVFIVLAQKAGSIPTDRPLSGWLLRTTRYVCNNARRLKQHRDEHERKAAEMAQMNAHQHDSGADDSVWGEMTPLLDEGLSKLKAADRDALLLKFFEKKSLREIGVALGVSEEAAAKRVSRAVDKLRDYFERRGVAVGSSAMVVMKLSDFAIGPAPAGLAPTVATAALAPGAVGAAAAGGVLAKGAIAFMTLQKIKALSLLAAAALLVVGGTTVVVRTMMQQPTRRQVAVQIERSPWVATFDDGTVFEVQSLTTFPHMPVANWWGADGRPVTVLEGEPMPAVSLTISEKLQAVDVRVRITGPNLAGRSFVTGASPRSPRWACRA